jgi:peptidoglycan-associated lipoprotein
MTNDQQQTGQSKDNGHCQEMSISRNITLYAVLMTFCLGGCSYQRKVVLAPTGLPEEIYVTPQENSHYRSAAIFRLREPSYPRDMGKAASEYLYEELLRNKVFASVTLETDVSDIRLESLMYIACKKDYDLIITGDLLYYFEGSLHRPSRVDERIRVIDADTGKTLWYAKAADIGPSAPYTDRIFVEGRGVRAPAARALLKRNAEKFCRMLLNLPPQDFSATSNEAKSLDGEQDSQVAKKDCEKQGPGVLGHGLVEDAKARWESAGLGRFLNEYIHFEFDKSRLLPEAKEILRRQAEWLKVHPDVSVIVEGHCDERGTSRYNMALGDRRARSTKGYMVELGIAPERLTTVSYGRERPADPDHDERAWAKNRRAEFLLE